MWWLAIIGVLLVCCVMEMGEKERRKNKELNTHNKEKGISAVIQDGMATFNAGLDRFNSELELKNQANKLLSDFSQKNSKAVWHFKLCASQANLIHTYRKFNGIDAKTMKEAMQLINKQINSTSSYVFKELRSRNQDADFSDNELVPEIEPLDDPNFYVFNFSILSGLKPELQTVVNEKIAEILNDTKYELRDVYLSVEYAARDDFFKILEELGEKELFIRITERR